MNSYRWILPLVFGILMPFSRGISGWTAFAAGDDPSIWVPPVTMALLWGALFTIGFVGEIASGDSAGNDADRPYVWGFVGVLAVMPIVSMAFVQLGYDPMDFFAETAGAIAGLIALVAIDRWRSRD